MTDLSTLTSISLDILLCEEDAALQTAQQTLKTIVQQDFIFHNAACTFTWNSKVTLHTVKNLVHKCVDFYAQIALKLTDEHL